MVRLFMLAVASATVLTLSPTAFAQQQGPPVFQPWIDGTTATEPQMQVQRYDRDTYVIRQSIRTNFEGPFLYLLFGDDQATLLEFHGENGLVNGLQQARAELQVSPVSDVNDVTGDFVLRHDSRARICSASLSSARRWIISAP